MPPAQSASALSSAGAAAQSAEPKAFCLMLLHEEADYSVPLLISAGKNDALQLGRRESLMIVPKKAVPEKQEREEFAA